MVIFSAGDASEESDPISGSLSGMRISSPLDVMDLLNCQSCEEPMYPPIYQCSNGHSTCSNCKNREDYCHPCRSSREFIRCFPFERLAAKLILNCRYYEQGCPDAFLYSVKLDHEQRCKFRPYNCPDPSMKCATSGTIQYLLHHLISHHKLRHFQSSRINVKCSLRLASPYGSGSRDLDVYSCLNQHFCFHFEAHKMPRDVVYIAFLTFLGDDSEGKDFRYRLEVNNGARKMAWVGAPRCIRNDQRDVSQIGDGLLLLGSVAKLFSAATADADNQGLLVTGRIWKEH